MKKGNKYDWKDSNLALFGSDLEKNVKKASAETEEAWQGSGQKVGVKIWRIVKFKVTHWPVESYGQFYDGDSYIILNTYKKHGSDELLYDLHFWIGKNSSQDEYGTAAYKTVELDTFHGDKPVQHREVQGHESMLFKSYFPTMTILKGGADTGFRKVAPKDYKPRLFHVRGEKKKVTVTQVGLRKSNLTSNDVFILDLGLTIYQWNGGDSNKDEKFKATQYLQGLKSDRSGKAEVKILEDGEEGEIQAYLSDKPRKMKDETDSKAGEKVLFKLSDADGTIKFTEVKRGQGVNIDLLDKNDVFVFDNTQELFVWVGQGASNAESNSGFKFAHDYLNKTDHPYIPVTIINKGKQCEAFVTALAA